MRIRSEDGWAEQSNQNDRLHDEDLVSSATEKESGNSKIGKVALRACGSMPTWQHNQRRSQFLHRLAHEHYGHLAPLAFIAGAISTGLVLRKPMA